jgi:hypothetical protein
MSAAPPPEHPETSAESVGDGSSRSRATSRDSDGSRALLRSARASPTLLAKHSAAAQSLVTTDEDGIDALVTCCAVLLREHAVGWMWR